jgi:uridylate kinase
MANTMETISTKPIYARILLKLSGEALQGDHLFGINANKLTRVSQELASVVKSGVQVALVIGGGNLIRGADLCATGLDRVTADQMGMLATVINGLALLDSLERKGVPTTLMSAIAIPGLVDFYDRHTAKAELEKGKLLIFVAGTGNPLVTTDSAAALRGIEVGADIVIKATKVDGVFAADPIKNPKAERYDQLTYDEVLEQRLGVMDLNAILLCREHALPLRVFNMSKQGALLRIVSGENVGTLIQSGD